MASSITIYKNSEILFEAKGIQEAARYLAEHFNSTKYKYYDHIERGYVYDIPYYVGEDEYRFVSPHEIAVNRRKQLEDRGHKNARRIWLMPASPIDYDVESAFDNYDTIDWKRSYNYENGDIIFIYVSGSIQKVRYKVEVIEGFVKEDDINYDHTFWLNEEKIEESKEYDYTRIRLLDELDTPELSLDKLREHGLKGNIQGSMKLKGDLLDYIMSFFKYDLTEGYYPEEVPEKLEEGKRKTISVNVYERNPIARKKCMERYGARCQVCDLDFEQMYGEVEKILFTFIILCHFMKYKKVILWILQKI